MKLHISTGNIELDKQVSEYCSTMIPEIDPDIAQVNELQFVNGEVDAEAIDLFNREANEIAFKLLFA